MDRPHWNEVLDALQEDVDICEDGETTTARDVAIAIPGGFYITDDGQEAIEENEVLQILLQAGLNVAQTSSRFLRPQTRCKWQRSGTAHEALEHSTAETAHAVCKMSQTWTLARECPEGNRGQRNDERYDRRAVKPEENITVAKPTERRPFFFGASWTFVTLDPGEVLWDTGAQEGLVWEQLVDKWCKISGGTRSPSRMQPGETRIRKRHWRRDATNRCCFCASWFGWVQWYHQIHCCGAGCPTSTAGGR